MQHVFTSIFCAVRSPEPNAKCAFWVKLYHKPRAACKAKWKVKNGRKYNNNNILYIHIYRIYFWLCTKPKTKAKWSRRESRVTAIMQIYDQNSIMCLLERSCCVHASSAPTTPLPLHAHSLCCCLWQPLPVHRYVRAEAVAAASPLLLGRQAVNAAQFNA